MRSLRLLSISALMATRLAAQQIPGQGAEPNQGQQQQQRGSRSNTSLSTPAGPAAGAENPFLGSIPGGQATDQEIPLTLQEAIARGLRQNLGLFSSGTSARSAAAEKLRALNALLPNITTRTSETSQQVNLAAFGFTGIGGFNIPSIVGPFQVFDARAYLSQNLFDYNAIQNKRAAAKSLDAATLSYRDARDTVVLVVVNLYLQAIAAAARVESQQAQLQTAQALYQLAQDQRTAGVVAGIDVLRAQVESQSERQRLIALRNDSEKAKLALSRGIGLPLGQRFRLVDNVPFRDYNILPLEDAMQQALATRADYKSAQARVRNAELLVSAARAERYPTLSADVNYGAIGPSPVSNHGTYTATGTLRIPIYQGTRVQADVEEAQTQLKQRQAELDNLRGQIDSDVRTSLLDVQSTSEQVQVATSSVKLAQDTLLQAQDRFRAGVTNNIEVIQAQQAVATANENLINSLYQFNYAKASLIRAIGGTQDAIQSVLKGSSLP